MRTSVAAVMLCLAISTNGQYRDALPGYRYRFPQDHFSHPDYQTEWWYYTGNVTADGHRFGFELTFFRQGVDRTAPINRPWDVGDLFLAHLALSDLDGGAFLHAERTNRAGPGIAGADEATGKIWNGNWKIVWQGGQQILQAVDQRFALNFTLQPSKPPVIQGQNGVSQKANGAGLASHYISMTRLETNGEIELTGKAFKVTGTAWMDHEFFTHQLEADQVGWDWMSIQLRDNTELMLYRIRRKDGSVDSYSAGSFVDGQGNSTYLRKEDFRLEPLGATWASPASHAIYPVQWRILVPKLKIQLECSTLLRTQELTSSSGLVPTYWEGATILNGSKGDQPIAGVGYLEMTGYDHAFEALH